MSVALLLPRARLDSVGINLEDFFRQALLAAKASHAGNLHFPLYPLSTSDQNSSMAFPSNTQIALHTASRLARFVVLPQEQALIHLYRQMAREAMRAGFPRRWQRDTFHQRYLAGIHFPLLALAFDALFWFLVRRTTRTLSVPEGLRLVHSFFLREDNQSPSERAQVVREEHASLLNPEMRRWETELELTAVPFNVQKTYLVVIHEDAPVEGMNTYFVQFALAPPTARLTTFIPEREHAVSEEIPAYRRQLEDKLRASFIRRFGSCLKRVAAHAVKPAQSTA